MNKPFAESCEQNKHVILSVLTTEFEHVSHVLEIGSGTGQHGVFFAEHLTHLIWQCSDRYSEIPGMTQWINEANLTNLPEPLELDVTQQWPTQRYDAIFSANAVHIMPWHAVEALFNGLEQVLAPHARVCFYGPFNFAGQFTSDSNARFDQWLKQRDPKSGIRDFEALDALARQCGLQMYRNYPMPANNHILCWQR